MTTKLELFQICAKSKWANLMELEGKQCTDVGAMKLYGCGFQAPSCLTWTRTDGNVTVTVLFCKVSSYKSIMITQSLSIYNTIYCNHCITIILQDLFIVLELLQSVLQKFGYIFGITWL